MTKQELKEQINAVIDAATIESENLTPVEYFKKHFLTITEAIIYAIDQDVKLTNHPIQQFHILCKNEKLESVQIGEKNTRIIVKESLLRWIAQQKAKQGKE